MWTTLGQRNKLHFLRQADRRPDQKLGVREIEETNELDLLMNVHRYKEIRNHHTEHTQQFMNFIFMNRPQYYKTAAPPPVVDDAQRKLKTLDRHAIFAVYRQLSADNATFQSERRHDLRDLGSVRPLNA